MKRQRFLPPKAKTLNEAESVEEKLSAVGNQQVPSPQTSNANTCLQILCIYSCGGLTLMENSTEKGHRRPRLLISNLTWSKKASIKPQEYS